MNVRSVLVAKCRDAKEYFSFLFAGGLYDLFSLFGVLCIVLLLIFIGVTE